MLLYIIRHAESEPARGAPRETPDAWHVTPRGRRSVARVLAVAERDMGFRPEIVLSSPSPRAQETATIVRETLGGDLPVAVEPAADPDAELADFYRAMKARKGLKSIATITHVPLISRLLPDLLGAEARIEIPQGGIACVQFEGGVAPGRGVLVWLLPPRDGFDGTAWT